MTDHEISVEVGRRIRALREERRLSVEVFAAMLHVSRAAVGMWERGDRTLTAAKLCDVASVLGAEPSDFVTGIRL